MFCRMSTVELYGYTNMAALFSKIMAMELTENIALATIDSALAIIDSELATTDSALATSDSELATADSERLDMDSLEVVGSILTNYFVWP